MRSGFTNEEIHNLTKIDPWFLAQLRELVDEEENLYAIGEMIDATPTEDMQPGGAKDVAEGWRRLHRAKSLGFSDRQIAAAWKTSEKQIRDWRNGLNLHPAYPLA